MRVDIKELSEQDLKQKIENIEAEKKALQNDIKEIFEEAKAMSKDLSKDGNKCIKCGARADRITINYDYICPDCREGTRMECGL